jgi:hypothetical protein
LRAVFTVETLNNGNQINDIDEIVAAETHDLDGELASLLEAEGVLV